MEHMERLRDHPLRQSLSAAQMGDEQACFDLGVAYSTGANGLKLDLVQAHKWFNLAAMAGSSEGQYCRAEISQEMSRADIVEAQRQARAWLSSSTAPCAVTPSMAAAGASRH